MKIQCSKGQSKHITKLVVIAILTALDVLTNSKIFSHEKPSDLGPRVTVNCPGSPVVQPTQAPIYMFPPA